jgi:DNA-binding NtrC family response regulator
MLVGDPTVTIAGISDVNPWAPGIDLARRLNLPIATDFRELVGSGGVDLVIDVTGGPEVHRAIYAIKTPATEVMGGIGARFMWDLDAERKRAEELEDRYSLVVRELQAQAEADFIIGQNPKMREVAELIARVAPAPTTVLVRGESGTGKELAARAIHKYSPLRDKPLLTVNCTALTPTLMDSELFGHRRGSFTGAVADKAGLFEKADGGTIFLDEIGDMPLEMQGKLLRVLQAGEIKPVGDVVTRRVRVRVIAATNRDLEQAMQRAEFREDLFYRFNTFTITLPSLRELENTVERAVVLASDRGVEPAHLPLHIQGTPPLGMGMTAGEGLVASKDRIVREFERQAVARLLAETRGNVSAAAKVARITRRNFHHLLAKHGIDPRGFKIES